jgi:hypothetical protein
MEDLVDELRKVVSSFNHLEESVKIEHLMEMSKLTSRETGLPVDIWVDEGRTFTKSGHGKRIKFQGDRNDPDKWIPLTVSADPQIPVDESECSLSSKEIRKIKQFVIMNVDALNRLGEPDFGITDFSKVMRKVESKKS